MKSGYKVLWTENALYELKSTIEYLEKHFSEKAIKKLALKIETVIELISKNPFLFPNSEMKEIRRVSILHYNTLYYRIVGDQVHILSFFSNRQNPKSRKLD